MSLDDTTFLASIHDTSLQSKYRKELSSIVRQAKREHKTGKNKLKEKLQEEIADREYHEEVEEEIS